jgi:hypothetical protein
MRTSIDVVIVKDGDPAASSSKHRIESETQG